MNEWDRMSREQMTPAGFHEKRRGTPMSNRRTEFQRRTQRAVTSAVSLMRSAGENRTRDANEHLLELEKLVDQMRADMESREMDS